MSLLNDALRKKRVENQNNSDTHEVRKSLNGRNNSRIKLSRIAMLLLLVGGIVLGLQYFVGALSNNPGLTVASTLIENEDTHQTAISVPDPKSEFQADKKAVPIALKSKPEIEPKKELQPVKPAKIQKQVTETVSKKELQHVALKTTNTVRKPIQKPPSRVPADKAESHSSREEVQFYRKALRYHRQGRLNQAVHMYEQVLKLKPDQPDAMFNLASAYIQMKAYAEAYSLLKRIKMLDSTNPDVLLNLAIVEIGLGRPVNAVHILDAAAKYFTKPQFPIHFHRAVALSRMGDLEGALAEYKKAEKLNTAHPSVVFNLGVISDKLQKYIDAVFYYQKYLGQNQELSGHEKKNINARIKTLQAFIANKQTNVEIGIDG